MKRTLRILLRCLALLLALCLLTVIVSAIVCAHVIKTTRYSVALDGIETPVRLVIAADLHGREYGKDNARLLQKVRDEQPDAIVLLGDLFPSHPTEADEAYVVQLTQNMQDIAQVYFAMGNHEKSYTAAHGPSWIRDVRATGAIVLDETWDDYDLGGNTVRLGGTMGHGYLFGRTREQYYGSPEYAVLSALEESPVPAILLSHMPDTVALSDAKEHWHIDLVLSAHTHGGVIRIPFEGGLFAPMQGWWPKYDYGDWMLNDQMRMIITSGLSGYDYVPRIFNLPEIEVIDLCAP
jgi:predicted MPP superfamily phosphohydrolase